MAKKIYDILPLKEEAVKPQKIKKTEQDSGFLPIKTVKPKEQKLPEQKAQSMPEILPQVEQSPKKERKEKKRFSWKFWLGIGLDAVILAACVYFYFSLQSAEIAIWPKTELASSSVKILADKSASQIDIENKKIPAEIFEIEKDLWQDFPATGQAQSSAKASGTITIYNKLNPPASFTLKTGTHFLSDSGKYFVTSQKITIPAGTFKSGKLVPGSINVKVTAEEPGKDYNIESSKFSVPKLVGTNYYYVIYAESESSMTGGFLNDVKKVTDLDLANAKKELSEKVLAEAEIALRQKISSEYILFDSAIAKKVTDTFSPVKSGAVVDSFSYQAKVAAKALAFKRSDIEKFAKDSIASSAPGKDILEQSFKLDFTTESVDFNNGSISLSADFSSKIYQPVNTQDFISLLLQKTEQESKDIISNRLPEQTEKIDIKFWPFWTSKIPTNSEKVKIDLKFE